MISLTTPLMKIGEVAKRSGLTVRTLHYYDEIGLLSPSERTLTDHRLYTATDLQRLHQIVSLRQLGFSLDQIRECLEDPAFSLPQVIQMQITHLKAQVEATQTLVRRLEGLAHQLNTSQTLTLADLIQSLESITMFEKYYTPEQLDTLKQRYDDLGPDRIQQAETEWQELIEQARLAMSQGVDPASHSVQQLAQRWLSLIQAFTGGDPEIQQSLETLYQQEGAESASRGMVDRAVMNYMGQAIARLQGGV